jgi:hypothetical protein
MITFKNKENTLAILLSRFMLVVETWKAKLNFIKVDSCMEKQKNNSEFISGYKYLISYYKKNRENQLKYISKLMSMTVRFQKKL